VLVLDNPVEQRLHGVAAAIRDGEPAGWTTLNSGRNGSDRE
jgi:hypothetical protein